MRSRVVDQVARPHRHLDDRGQPAVPVGVVPGAVPRVVRQARVRRPDPRRRHHMDARPRGGPARGVRRAGLHRDVQLGRGLGERLREPRHVPRQLHPAAAQVRAVQSDLEIRAQLVDDARQGPGLGRQPVRREHGRRPLGLLRTGGPEEAEVVVEEAARRRRDVQARPVGVRAQQEVPGDAVAQLPLRQDPPGEREQGAGAGRLVGVGAGDHQYGTAGPAHGQQVQRPARARDTHLPQGAHAGMLNRQRPGSADLFGHRWVAQLRQDTHPRHIRPSSPSQYPTAMVRCQGRDRGGSRGRPEASKALR